MDDHDELHEFVNDHPTDPAAHAGTYVALEKTDNGGAFPAPLRVPTLVVKDTYPNRRTDYKIAWVEGDTLYAVGYDKTVRKSTDAGATWTTVANYSFTLLSNNTFLKLADGTLLSGQAGTPQKIARSTDDGVTWTEVHSMRTSATLMGAQSWCEDGETGDVYAVEYQTVDTFTDILILRSTDSGATFSTFATLPGPASADAAKVRHIHSCQYDDVSERVYFLTGDTETAAGIYRVNAAGTGVEAVVLNSDMVANGFGSDTARAIGMMWFPDYIAWTSDSTSNPNLFRLPRTQIGTSTPNAEQIYRLNGTGWFSAKADDDGDRWIVTSAPTSQALDSAVHLYAVEDQGATIYEVGAIASDVAVSSNAALAPVGQAEIHGDVFWLQTHGYTNGAYYKCQLARGTTPMPLALKRPLVYGLETLACPTVTVPSGDEVIFGHVIAPSTNNRLYVFDYGVRKTSGSGTLRVRLRNESGGAIVASVDGSVAGQRNSSKVEAASHLADAAVTSQTVLEAVIVNTSGSEATGTAHITLGWGA